MLTKSKSLPLKIKINSMEATKIQKIAIFLFVIGRPITNNAEKPVAQINSTINEDELA